MSIESSSPVESQNGDCRDTVAQTATQKSIHQIKEDYCQKLRGMVGGLSESEVGLDGAIMVYERKKCCFVKTEKNYLLIRNLELKIGVELIQASAEIKKNVTDYSAQNDALVVALKAVVKSAKDAKSKFGDLRDSASKLDACMKDSCSAIQMRILGCSKGDDCNDTKQEDTAKKPDACQNVCKILDDMVTIPESLSKDIDIIFNSAAEIVGIQSFSNIQTITTFQQDFASNAKDFDDLVQAQTANDAISLKKAQDDLTLAIKILTQSDYAVYNQRNDVETIDAIKDHLCCHECKCIGNCGCEGENAATKDGDNRLKQCKCDICEICNEVTTIYCNENPPNGPICD